MAILRNFASSLRHSTITDLIAADILAFEGESRVEWFEGNFLDYEKDKMQRWSRTASSRIG
jgi:hypothetical protein